MPTQIRNPEMVGLLSADLQPRNEPNFAWKSAASALQGIPGLIAAWPMSVLRLDSATERVRDVGGGGYHLTTVNGPTFRNDGLTSNVALDGTNDYLMRTAGAASWASVIGNEAYISGPQQGLFLGGLFYFDDAPPPAADEILIGKRSAAAGNYSYWIDRDSATGRARFYVSNDGTALTSVTSGATALAEDTWYFIAGRFNNTTNEIKLWIDSTSWTAAYNNVIFDGTADFAIGSESGGGRYMDGRASLCFLSAMAVNDAMVFSVFQQTRAMFGV